jgi:hypothetical protein
MGGAYRKRRSRHGGQRRANGVKRYAEAAERDAEDAERENALQRELVENAKEEAARGHRAEGTEIPEKAARRLRVVVLRDPVVRLLRAYAAVMPRNVGV